MESSDYAWILIFGLAAFITVTVLLLFLSKTSAEPTFRADDPELAIIETPSLLALLSEDARLSYERAKVFQLHHPPGSVSTDITASQMVSIQEKGVAAFEFEWELESSAIVSGRTEIQFIGTECSVQTNLPLPRNQDVYYWEAKMFDKPPTTTVAVGVATKPYPSWRLPGWNQHSVGYFSDTGDKHLNNPFRGYPFGRSFVQGDVVGVGYRHRTRSIFYTLNGRKLGEACVGLPWNLFPTIGANGPCQVHVNLGQMGFLFVEANIKKWGLAPMQGTIGPPPAYGAEAGSRLLEASAPINVGTPPPPHRMAAHGLPSHDTDDDHAVRQPLLASSLRPSPPSYSALVQ